MSEDHDIKSIGKVVQLRLIGFPLLFEFFTAESVEFRFSGVSLKDLIYRIIELFGEPARKSFLVKGAGEIEPAVQARVNDRFVKAGSFDRESLNPGDTVTLMRLLAGG